MIPWRTKLFLNFKFRKMNYLESILWLISWPVLIIVSYQLVKYFLKRVKYL